MEEEESEEEEEAEDILIKPSHLIVSTQLATNQVDSTNLKVIEGNGLESMEKEPI